MQLFLTCLIYKIHILVVSLYYDWGCIYGWVFVKIYIFQNAPNSCNTICCIVTVFNCEIILIYWCKECNRPIAQIYFNCNLWLYFQLTGSTKMDYRSRRTETYFALLLLLILFSSTECFSSNLTKLQFPFDLPKGLGPWVRPTIGKGKSRFCWSFLKSFKNNL
jgi:hypothetical protein